MNPQQQCLEFIRARRSLVISTQDNDGLLETSVVPFVESDGCFYIFVSELAKHTQNLLAKLNQNESEPLQISALMLADESETEQLFARERIGFQLRVVEVVREEARYDPVLALFAERFGDVVEVLNGLPDFHLFELSSQNGSYVRGFGQAFAFQGLPETGLTRLKTK